MDTYLRPHLGRMAWSMPDEREHFDLQTMIEHFDLKRISLGGPIFDTTKLDWLNGTWIREELDDEAFADNVQAWAMNREYLMPIIPLIRQRVNKWSDLAPLAGFFLEGLMPLTPEQLTFKGLETEDTRRIYAYALWALDATADGMVPRFKDLAPFVFGDGTKLRVFRHPSSWQWLVGKRHSSVRDDVYFGSTFPVLNSTRFGHAQAHPVGAGSLAESI